MSACPQVVGGLDVCHNHPFVVRREGELDNPFFATQKNG